MARIRTIKPEFFLSEHAATVSRDARLAFIGLWTQADRAGRLLDRPRRLKAVLFPYDADVDMEQLLVELVTAQLLQRYHVEGDTYLAIPTLATHQHFHVKEPPSSLPAPPASPVSTRQAPCLPDGSTMLARQEGKGRETRRNQEGTKREGGVGETASPPARLATGTRVPDRPLPDLWAQFAVTLGLDPAAVYAEFLDYWRGVPGQKGRKLDWDGTWRNRCRELAGRTRNGRPGEHPRTRGNVAAAKEFITRGDA